MWKILDFLAITPQSISNLPHKPVEKEVRALRSEIRVSFPQVTHPAKTLKLLRVSFLFLELFLLQNVF